MYSNCHTKLYIHCHSIPFIDPKKVRNREYQRKHRAKMKQREEAEKLQHKQMMANCLTEER